MRINKIIILIKINKEYFYKKINDISINGIII